MADTWIINLTHYLDEGGTTVSLPPQARRLAEFFGSIARAVSTGPRDTPILTGVWCRRRPRRKPCKGIIVAVVDSQSEEIRWQCPHCHDNGLISGWRNTPWDTSEAEEEDRLEETEEEIDPAIGIPKSVHALIDLLDGMGLPYSLGEPEREKIPAGAPVPLRLTPYEYRLLMDHTAYRFEPGMELVQGRNGVRVDLPLQEIAFIQDYVLESLERCEAGELRQDLDELHSKLQFYLDAYEEEEAEEK